MGSWSISTASDSSTKARTFSYTYAKCGREVLRLPWRTAYQIFDNKTRPLLRSEYNRGFHVSADSIEALAKIAWSRLGERR